MRSKAKSFAMLSIALLIITLSTNICSSQLLNPKPTENNISYIIHEGNLTIADNEVYLIDGCNFRQIGNVLVKDNATLLVRNSTFNQTSEDPEFITLTGRAKLIVENSSLIISQFFDVKILLYDQAMLNVTGSNVTNHYLGIWIWMEDNSEAYITNTKMSPHGEGSRVVTDHNSKAEIRYSTLDYVVGWGNSTANVFYSQLRKAVKIWSTTKVHILNSSMDFIWTMHYSRIEIQNSIVYSTTYAQPALLALGNSYAYLFNSTLKGNINTAEFATVRLRNSSVQNVSAYDNAIVWLVNSTAKETYSEGEAKIYCFSSIQDAINNANEGEYVVIPSGIYHEHVIIDKKISLIGEEKTTTFIDGDGKGIVVNIIANDTFVSGFTIQNGEYAFAADSTYNCTITNNNITNSTSGICLDVSRNCIITFNTISNNGDGLNLYASNSCIVKWNDLSCNNLALRLNSSNFNIIYQNNFVNNTNQAFASDALNNTFDDGIEGNYWSNYTGVDLNHDGIGESHLSINENNQDNYPLMGMFHIFRTSLNYSVNVISNFTIRGFQYVQSNSTIKLHVSSKTANQTLGFYRICISNKLMNLTGISVIIDNGNTIVLYPNYTLHNNASHLWIYFAHQGGTHEILIISELPSIITLLIMTLPIIIVYKKKKTIRNILA